MKPNLIDAYVSEVGRRLPRKNRSDIEAEIRSTLQDMLDERSQKTGKPVEEEMTIEVLRAYGAPEKVAGTYLGERYLIGPRLYPTFLVVIRIALLVIGVLAAIGLGVAVYQTTLTPVDAIQIIIKAIADFIATSFTSIGSIALIFAILEWALSYTGRQVEFKGLPKDKEWDPRGLLKLSPTNVVKMSETIVEIVGCCVAIVLFNFYPQVFSFGLFSGGGWYIGAGNAASTPLLSETFFNFVPYLTAVWVLTILLDIILLRLGQWNVQTRICLIGLKAINIFIAALMLGAPSLLAITTASLTPALGSAEEASTLMNILTIFVRIALGLGIFGNAVEIIRTISRMASNDILPQFSVKD
ncbi:MAG TPA: hypothetical protein VMT91_07215 [Anaerolineales bacterium]|nr:hypothetical protein [Anaerolineales bacterium]